MRSTCFTLLLAVAAGAAPGADEATVRDEKLNFAISMPDSIDWEQLAPAPDKEVLKAHFKTEYAGTEPKAFAEVQLLVYPMGKELASRKLENIAKQWADAMEQSLDPKNEVKEGSTTLAGHEAYFRDVKGLYISGPGHITWYVGRMGRHLYIVWIIRTFKAVGDEMLEEEIKEVVGSFKYLQEIKVEPDKNVKKGQEGPGDGPAGKKKDPGEDEPDPSLIEREEKEEDFWRFEYVKPQGLIQIPPDKFDETEKSNNVVVKLERVKNQSRLMIRVYAQSDLAKRYTIEQLAERNLKAHQNTYPEKARLEPEIDNRFKGFPLVEEGIKMKLVGRRSVPETTYWYLLNCKNDRQYQIQIYITGATGEKDWEPQLKDFLKSFKPVKK